MPTPEIDLGRYLSDLRTRDPEQAMVVLQASVAVAAFPSSSMADAASEEWRAASWGKCGANRRTRGSTRRLNRGQLRALEIFDERGVHGGGGKSWNTQ